MEGKQKPDSREVAATAMPQMGAGTTPDKEPSVADRRIERIEEYHRDSLKLQDPLRANLNVSVADLMFIRDQLFAALKKAMVAGTVPLLCTRIV